MGQKESKYGCEWAQEKSSLKVEKDSVKHVQDKIGEEKTIAGFA